MLIADPDLLLGQTIGDIQAVAERLRQSLYATSVRVIPDATRSGCRIVWRYSDPLAAAQRVDLDNRLHPMVPAVGVTEDNRPWTLPLGPSTLVAANSGGGKSTLTYDLLIGLGEAIHAGWVHAWGVDLKAGVELSMGRELFARLAVTPSEAVELLEEAVAKMQERLRDLSGHSREHSATRDEPHVLIVIDELAAVTAYCPDRDLRARAAAAISLLASQGRSAGFTVFACLQDPRKETVPMRGLFTRTIGLRLSDAQETVMVLGRNALDAGAACHEIPASTPGVGYMVPRDGGEPIRARAFHVTDEDIRTAAQRFAPWQPPVIEEAGSTS